MAEKMNTSLEGIVISSREYRDADRSVTIFAKDKGKYSFVARGVRKLVSKNRSSTDIFILGEYLLGRGKAYPILKQGKILESFIYIRKDLIKSSIAMTMTTFLNEVLVENNPQNEVYSLFHWSLRRLENSKDPMMLLRYFIVKSILFLGHKPSMDSCSKCNGSFDESYYQFDEGTVLCKNCTSLGFLLEFQLVELYKCLENDDFMILKNQSYDKSQLEKFDFFLEKLVEHIIDKRFNGFEYLKKLTF